MLTEKIYLYSDEETVVLKGKLPFACTNSFFTKCKKQGIDPEEVLYQIASNNVFLITRASWEDYEGNWQYLILTDKIVLICSIKEMEYLLITGVMKKHVRTQNEFIRNSVKLYATKGAISWYSIPNANRTKYYTHDEGDPNPKHAKNAFYAICRPLEKKLEDYTTYLEEEDAEITEEVGISDEAEHLLNMAHKYVVAEDEVLKRAVQSSSQASYIDFEPASDHMRVEKIAYKFFVYTLSKGYKKGVRISISLDDESEASGTIVEITDDENPIGLTILFDEKFNIGFLPKSGIINLQYNPVQKIVREKVIEELSSVECTANYFSDVLGLNQFRGFEDKNLEKVVSSLRGNVRPPNESQIEAIVRGINVKDALLVLGPPGTGKTTVILEWVKYFVKKEKRRVLISSQNNKAVDNVLERLAQESDIETIRVGSEEKVQNNIKHLMFENRAYEFQQKIVESTDKALEKFSKDKGILSVILSKSSEAKNLLVDFEETNEMIIDKYDYLEGTIVSGLRINYDLYHQNLALIDKLEGKIKNLALNIKEYRMKEQGFLRTLSFPFNKIDEYRLKHTHKKHEEAVAEQRSLVDRYNNLMLDLNKEISSVEFRELKEKWTKLRDGWKLIKSDLISNLASLNRKHHFMDDIKDIDKEMLDELIDFSTISLEKIVVGERAINRWRELLINKQNYALAKVLLDSVDLVGATCIGINSQQRFQDLNFDVTIIDEAGQIQIQNAIVPMSRSPKLIMLGDHLQIPPTNDKEVFEYCFESGAETDLLEISLFEYLYKRFPEENKILLDTQYRMPGEIADLLSQWFYENKYLSFKGKRNLSTPLKDIVSHPFVVVSTSDYIKRSDNKIDQSYCNKYEAEIVIALLKNIFSTINPDTIHEDGGKCFLPREVGVITPYSGQVQYLRERVQEAFPLLTKEDITDLIASLDSFQGQERPIILYSCTRSNTIPKDAPRIGFLNELRRLNVALSRCQSQLVFIGDMDFLSNCEYEGVDTYGEPIPGASEREFSAFIRLMINHIQNGNGQLLQSKEILSRLKREGGF